ncbi:MAG: class I SAM-dependent methyltransferase [Vicingaceae bacterium]
MGLLRNLFLDAKQKRHALVGAPKYWKLKQQFQYDFLIGHGLKEGSHLLDIGCGTLRGGIPLIKFLDDKNYTGIEVREAALIEGRKELADEGLEYKEPKLICFDDFSELKLDEQFDFILAFSVLFHLEDSIAKKCFEFVGRSLKNEGVFYANVNADSGQNGKWLEFPVMHRDISFYREICQASGLSLKVLGKLKEFGHLTGDDKQDHQVMLEIKKS